MSETTVSERSARRTRGAWVLFDWAAQPFYTIVLTFIFGPYFVAHVAANPVEGQSLWGIAAAAGGVTIAILSPVLGAVADQGGRRMLWLALFSAALIAGMACLWFAVPGAGEGRIYFVLGAFALAMLGAEFATVFTNAMLPDIARPGGIGRLSGLGWGVGYLGGLASLFIMLVFIVAESTSGRTLAGLSPLFGDALSFAGERASGPFSAVWYFLFVLPLFLFAPPEAPRPSARTGIGAAMKSLAASLRDYGLGSAYVRFLFARMIYADGLAALFTFGGVYAASVFGWGATQLGLFGILLTLTGAGGAIAGGRADEIFGPRRVIMFSLAALAILGVLALSAGRDHILFVIGVKPADGGLFASVAERFYLVVGALIGVFAGPVQAASRNVVTQLAHPARMTEAFGLFAFSGKATAFLAPALVALVTTVSDSQRIGIAVVVLFMLVGLALFTRVPIPEAR
ncbi:MAG: MFS transporter [Rhodobiaceae bacterium]|nr:MFS transporter [Rhodobiaceae bacterium]MCC0055482.1 MFS transporter [Rhodobiaceae bacterium]